MFLCRQPAILYCHFVELTALNSLHNQTQQMINRCHILLLKMRISAIINNQQSTKNFIDRTQKDANYLFFYSKKESGTQ